MANTESLIVELDAKTRKIDAKLRATEKRMDELDGSVQKTDTSLSKMSVTAKSVGKILGAVGVAATALTAGTIALIKQTTLYGKELKIASKLAGVAIEEFQGMAFATNTVGIGIEKLGDISKDTREKIGDFLNTGGGGFQDFVDAMKLTKAEAKLVADEFSVLSGPQILQEMVTRMEEANVSAVQMSHALEGMASDTTNLIPLLANSGAEMKRLSDAMSDVTVPLTDEDLKKLEDLDTALNLAASSASNLANKVLIDLSDWFVNAANAAAFFFATMNEGSRADLQTELLPIIDEIQEIEDKLNRASGSEETRLKRRLDKLIIAREEVRSAISELDSKVEQPEIQKTDINGTPENKKEELGLNADEKEKARNAIIDRFKDEEDLLLEKLERELEIIGENQLIKEELLDEHLMNIVSLHQKEEDDLKKIKDKTAKEDKKLTKQEEKDKKNAELSKLSTQESAINAGIALNTLLFDDNKAIAAGLIVADTATGIQKSLAINPYDYVNVGIIAATGAVNLANALGASKSGGSISGASSGGGVNPSQQNQPVQEEELSSLTLSAQDEDSASITTIRFATDSGDQLLDILAEGLNNNMRQGR